MAVGDHVRPLRGSDQGADLVSRLRESRRVEQRRLVDPPRARDMALAGIAGIALLPPELRVGPDVEDK